MYTAVFGAINFKHYWLPAMVEIQLFYTVVPLLLPHILQICFCKFWLSHWSVCISLCILQMFSICPSKSLLPHPTLLLKKAVWTTSTGFLWPLGSVGLASGICSRRWEGGKERVRSGYLFPWLLPFEVSSGQMCSSARSHCTSWWPTPSTWPLSVSTNASLSLSFWA